MDSRTAAVFALVLLWAVAPAPGQANSISDYPANNDWCNAVDPDGTRAGAPVGDDFSCDGNAATTTERIEVGNSFFVRCADDDAAGTRCVGGLIMNADATWGHGNFGGDYPVAASVTVTSDPPGLYGFRTCWVTVAAGFDTCTAVGAATCVGNGMNGAPPYVAAVGGGGTLAATDPPADTTIDQIIGFLSIDGGAGCGGIGAGARSAVGTWTYAAPAALTGAAVALAVGPLGPLGCPIAWTYAATKPDGAYGESGGGLYINGGILGTAKDEGPDDLAQAPTDSDVASGIATAPPGSTIEVEAHAWAIGSDYATAYASGVC